MFDISEHHLPLQLIKSEAIPPAPNRSESAIDWLPDFSGYSWIAYGASSLLVISHFPSPLSDHETLIGPIFRQVFELSSDGSGSVSAVSWSTVTPSLGDLAASLDNCIGLFSYNSDISNGSFCWSQTAVLVQSTKVETIKWTGSGDGIVSGGIEVVLWRKNDRSWEIAWKLKPELPQTLVSTTGSIEGPSATAPQSKLNVEGSSSPISKARKSVFVIYSDGRSKYEKAELCHPLPVSMIQWRPSTTKQSKKHASNPLRMVLLTCCIDGTVRLWTEIDDGRVRKIGKEFNDQRTMRFSFRVSAVIEINQAMNGTLGSDIFVRWATEFDGIFNIGKDAGQYFCSDDNQQERAGRCEWLIGFGPQMLVSLWAIHCLDDVAPMRFPRVTLWKRQELTGPDAGASSLLLHKVAISRNQTFGPPSVCSLIRLLPCNSLDWLQLNSQTPPSTVEGSLNKSQSENPLLCCANGMLNVDGHGGKILQVAMHSYGCEFEIAASLGIDGSLLFWSLSTISNCIMGLPTLNPAWKLSGKHEVQGSHPKYNTLKWAPTVLDEERVIFVGHAEGIDCFIVKVSTDEEKILCHYLGTIPFISCGQKEELTSIYAIPLPSTCDKTFVYNTFMLIPVWTNNSQALSWKVTIHPYDLPGKCGCSIDIKNTIENGTLTFKSNFAGKTYCVSLDACSSICPDPHNQHHITSFAVLCPTNFVSCEEEKSSNSSAYHMVTGCSDGSLKLWKCMMAAQPSNSNSQWEVVGVLAAHEGPILRVSAADCGRKIATVSPTDKSNTCSTLHIWGSVHLSGAGSFILEDILSFEGEVVSLNWLTIGNGQLLLGLCLQNELRVYAQRRCGGQNLVKSEKHLERNIWVCVALTHTYPAIRDFFWGPKATAVVVHDDYFCLFSQWLFPLHENLQATWPKTSKDNLFQCNGGSDEHIFTENSKDADICDVQASLVEDNGERCWSKPPMKMNLKNDLLSSMSVESFKQKSDSGVKIGFWSMLEVAENIGGSLPVYHPEVLLMNICSGNWKRAHIALRHLVDYLTSNSASLKRYGCVIPPIHLSNYLEGNFTSSSGDKTFQWSGNATSITSSSQLQKGPLNQFASSWGSDTPNNSSTSFSVQSELGGFAEPLEKFYDRAAITNTEKMQILAIVDLLLEVSNPHSASAYGSLDEPGRRFWVSVRFQHLYFFRTSGRLPSAGELVVDSGLIGWAFHSDCQENLFNSLLSNEPSWQEMRNMGVGFWYTNATQLRSKMEKLARQQYLKRKDPKDCALLYIALNRLQVLAGLFKISKDEKDKPLVGFLSRNFQEDKNKAAALKNAFVLMGRHQLELACAFFLLGGDTSSAITVCAKNLGDEQLALVICRLVEGYGGPLERHLLSKYLLPSAIEKGDYWSASFLEWVLGNYTRAFLSMLDVKMDSLNSAVLSNHASFLDPSIGQYCITLATKNSMKNAIGERNAAVLGRWAISMSATALTRCGLPLEALECYSSSLSIFAGLDQGSASDTANPEPLNEMLKPCLESSSSNWIVGDVAFDLESHTKLGLAMQYIGKLLREHPSWPHINTASPLPCIHSETEIQQYKILLGNFQHMLSSGLAYFDQKFCLIPLQLINLILISLCNNGLEFIGFHVLLCCTSKDPSQEKSNALDGPLLLYPNIPRLLLKATEEFSYLFSRYVTVSSITCSHLKSCSTGRNVTCENRFGWLVAWGFYVQGLIHLLWSLRTALKLFSGFCAEDLIKIPSILDLSEYCVYFASAWLQQNFKGLIMIAKPLFVTYTNGQTPSEISVEDLNKLLRQMAELLTHNSSLDDVGDASQTTKPVQHEHVRDIMHLIPEDERWQIIGASLWGHVSDFLIQRLNSLPEKLEESYPFRPPCGLSSSFVSNSTRSELDSNNTESKIELVSVVLAKLLKITFSHISSFFEKQLALFLMQKIRDKSSSPTLLWLEEFSLTQPEAHHKHLHGLESRNTMCNGSELSAAEILWDMCADPKIICGRFARGDSKWPQCTNLKDNKRWSDVYISVVGERGTEETCNHEGGLGSHSASSAAGSPVGDPGNHSFLSSGGKDTTPKKKFTPFHNPKEIYKRNGELLEALCINSIDQQQAVLASNRKGIIFFNWDDGLPSVNTADHIWTKADWPHDGWAGSESTPVPTCVSPGVGLGSKKGTHLGLGGATLGVDSLARPVRDFTGVGGAVGISGYSNMSASRLGWEIQEDFEEFVDPPATVENVRTRAFSSHPSRPFFLVGSSNTHVYLWEFGKERATATYGVLPAANVPPPYALASISAVHFDHCGQRFATAALDGTVCTWQLEVGGRSNIRPTESSLCFNNHASDVTYVTASGSIIAVAGYSSDGVNVVIWDTLAPSTTSRASIMCHEGGASSICVFDDEIGSGSISPLIVTGGKGGDVGLHDFRYIATGRSKRHKHSDSGEQNINASLTTDMRNKNGDQNRNGMLWYIPKAHLGSVTSVSAIPNTSLFLTGSKDGDVKLWDANKAKLVFHWPKLHDRHTFMQPGYRGFGGVVRDAITDIQVVSNGFLTCGGDGSVKLVQLKDFPHGL